jgi:hypothetical protein
MTKRTDAPYFIILLCLMPDYFTLSILPVKGRVHESRWDLAVKRAQELVNSRQLSLDVSLSYFICIYIYI